MTQLQQTLSRCATDVLGFAVMFFIIFLAYAQLGYLVFGTVVFDFYSLTESIYTLFRIILGDFNFHDLEKAHRQLGPIYFITYVFLVFFVLINMFLAIINDTYSEVKADIALQESEFELADYIKRGYDKVLKKLHLKKEHITDIQAAIQSADVNNDKFLDWDEWRNDLRMRGIPDNEIEAVFAKYDTDGDLILDEEEQAALKRDLEKQKNELDSKIKNIKKTSNKVEDETEKSIMGSIANADTDMKSVLEDSRGTSEEIISKLAKSFVSHDEFSLNTKRIDRLERSVHQVGQKIDALIIKLDAVERIKARKKDNVSRVLDHTSEVGSVKSTKSSRPKTPK